MRVRVLGTAAIGVLLLAVVATTALARANGDYLGRIEADSNTFIEFTVSGQGKNRKVQGLSIVGVTRSCNNSLDDGRMGQLKADKGFRVNKKGKFSGRVKATPIERPAKAATKRVWFMKLNGRIGKHKNASGTVEAHTLPGSDHCYTGALHWTAKTPPPDV